MELITILKNKYFQILLVALAALIFGFTSGYSYKADKVELERLQQFEKIQGKLDKVKEFSENESNKAKNNMSEIDTRLNIIIGKIKQKPLSNVPCTPSEDFSKAWMEIDNVTKKPNS